MKKTLISMCLFVCAISTSYAQQQIVDATYSFAHAELIIENYETKEVVEQLQISDVANIDDKNIHLSNIILEILTQNEELQECVLLDKKRYQLDAEATLQPAVGKTITTMNEETLESYLFKGNKLPPYYLEAEGNKLLIHYVSYNFGQSDINYTMQATLTVSMIKQKEE